VVLLAVLGGLAFLVFRPTPKPAAPGRDCDPPADIIGAGDKLPAACRVEPFEGGGLVTLAELQDRKPLVLNFWASWCRDCLREMPDFQRVYAAAKGRVMVLGVDVVGVLLGGGGETERAGREFAERVGAHYPLAFDQDWVLYQHFSKRPGLPATVFVKADGTIAHVEGGALSAGDLKAAIRAHFGVDLGS
jgi:thiol-disulfide isomerase/thioredoxin